MEEAVLGGLEHRGRIASEAAVFSADCSDGAVARVGQGVVEVAYGLVGEFVACIWLMTWAMCCCLWVCHCCRSALMRAIFFRQPCVCWRACGVSVWRRVTRYCLSCQSTWSMLPRAVVALSSLFWALCWKPQATAALCMAVSRVGRVLLHASGAVIDSVVLGPGLFVVP